MVTHAYLVPTGGQSSTISRRPRTTNGGGAAGPNTGMFQLLTMVRASQRVPLHAVCCDAMCGGMTSALGAVLGPGACAEGLPVRRVHTLTSSLDVRNCGASCGRTSTTRECLRIPGS